MDARQQAHRLREQLTELAFDVVRKALREQMAIHIRDDDINADRLRDALGYYVEYR